MLKKVFKEATPYLFAENDEVFLRFVSHIKTYESIHWKTKRLVETSAEFSPVFVKISELKEAGYTVVKHPDRAT